MLVARTVAQNLSEIAPGEGGIVATGDHKVAVYRDANGNVHDALGQVHAHGVHREVERGREDVGLPVPRLAVRADRRGGQRAGANARSSRTTL